MAAITSTPFRKLGVCKLSLLTIFLTYDFHFFSCLVFLFFNVDFNDNKEIRYLILSVVEIKKNDFDINFWTCKFTDRTRVWFKRELESF